MPIVAVFEFPGEDVAKYHKVFEVGGGRISVTDNWHHGHGVDKGDRWEPADIGPVVRDLLAKTEPVAVIGAR